MLCVLPFKDEIVGNARGRAEIVKLGRRIANVRVLAWQDDPAKSVAAGIGNFLL